MERRELLLAIGAAFVSGCNSPSRSSSPNVGTITEKTESSKPPHLSNIKSCPNARRPKPTVNQGIKLEYEFDGEKVVYESVGSEDYPTLRRSGDKDSFISYIKKHESVYKRNELVQKHGKKLTTYAFSLKDIDETTQIEPYSIAKIQYVAHWETVSDSGETVVSDQPLTVTYIKDSSALVRSTADIGYDSHPNNITKSEVNNHLDSGTLLVCF